MRKRKVWYTFSKDGGWTLPLKMADDLPAVALYIGYWYSSESRLHYVYSQAWVVDPDHPLGPMFINHPAVDQNGKELVLLGGGEHVLLEGWLENNFYFEFSRWKEELVAESRHITREVFESPPDWMIDWLRREIKAALEEVNKHAEDTKNTEET